MNWLAIDTKCFIKNLSRGTPIRFMYNNVERSGFIHEVKDTVVTIHDSDRLAYRSFSYHKMQIIG